MIAKHFIFVGHVQGVGFRFTAHRIAKRSQLTGYVRNLPDGCVEMLAQGEIHHINEGIIAIQENFTGYISGITVDDVPPDPKYTDFKITF